MPVLFRCCQCRSVLKVGRRKVGQQVECPRCRTAMIVPASAVVVPRQKTSPRDASDQKKPQENIQDEEVLSWLGSSATREPAGSRTTGPEPAAAKTVLPPKESTAPAPGAETAASRSVLPAAPAPDVQPQAADSPPEFFPESEEPFWSKGQLPLRSASAETASSAPETPPAEGSGVTKPPASPGTAPLARTQETPPSPAAVSSSKGPPPVTVSRPLVVWILEEGPDEETPPYVLVSRSLLYLQAVLMLVGVLLLGWGGYYLGSRSSAPGVELQPEEVLLAGTVLYWNKDQEVVPDHGAVVLLLPAQRHPPRPLSARVFQPGQQPRANDPNLLKLEEWGGAMARVDQAGNYRLAVPAPGSYLVLILSHHARRARNQPVEKQIMDRLQQWFTPAGVLLGRSKYLLQQVEVPSQNDAPVYLHHFFGRDAGE